ncbi:MAG: glutamine amidotransferase [Clostridia bacterium]
MNKRMSILFVGESWFIETTERKGFDSFTVNRYEECAHWVGNALKAADMDFTHIPCHRVEYDFPQTLEALRVYDVLMLSDVGANTFLLPTQVFVQGKKGVNKLTLIRDFVEQGGGLCMIGGYMTFQGLQGKACYKRTSIEEILPVTLLEGDDRVEIPEGFSPAVVETSHPIFDGIDEAMPFMLGYNRTVAKPDAKVLLRNGDDPIIVVSDVRKGRTMAYTCDCSPHWASPELCNWRYYNRLWVNITRWLARK